MPSIAWVYSSPGPKGKKEYKESGTDISVAEDLSLFQSFEAKVAFSSSKTTGHFWTYTFSGSIGLSYLYWNKLTERQKRSFLRGMSKSDSRE